MCALPALYGSYAHGHLYEDYYDKQSGSGMTVYVGRRYQHGHGLAQTIGGLFKRYVIPFVALRAKQLG